MTPEEITALAREYVEETVKGTAVESLPDGFKENVIQRNANHFEKHFRWLLRRYALVENSRVTDEYKRAIETNRKGRETGAYSLCTMGSARKVLLESLFPELAKEVEK